MSNIFSLLFDIISMLVGETVNLLNNVVDDFYDARLYDYNINIVLFSETPILSTDLYQLSLLFFTFFYSMFFIVLLYKATKKFINMIFGVFKL